MLPPNTTGFASCPTCQTLPSAGRSAASEFDLHPYLTEFEVLTTPLPSLPVENTLRDSSHLLQLESSTWGVCISPPGTQPWLTLPGPFFDELPAEGEEITFRGSLMGCVAESREAVVAILKKDPYTTNNVWNWEKVCIMCFLPGRPTSANKVHTGSDIPCK